MRKATRLETLFSRASAGCSPSRRASRGTLFDMAAKSSPSYFPPTRSSPVAGIPVTASFGVGVFPEASNGAALVQAADQALYVAKNRGRNLVRLHGEPATEKPASRDPERKIPEAGTFTEAQKTEMRRKLLRNQRIECPADGAYFVVHEVTSMGSVGKEFLIVCPDCGVSDTLSGPTR